MTALIRGARLDDSVRLLEPARSAALRSRADPGEDDAIQPASESHAETSMSYTDAQMPFDGAGAYQEFALTSGPETAAETDPSEADSGPPRMTEEQFRAQLNDEIAQLKASAEERGYQDGLTSGRAKVETESAERMNQLTELVSGLRAAFDSRIEDLVEVGAEIVFEAVTRIVGRSYIDGDGVTAVVREVVRHAKDRTRLVIRVSPADYREIEAARDTVTEGWNTAQVEVVADDRVELGGCLLETPGGNLDGRLEVQLQQLRDTLINARLRKPESVL